MALYHTHRPQLFDDVINQEHIITTLKNQIVHHKVAHAYLFSGPRGIGKTTTARILAKALNCENRKDKEYEPCNACPSCTEIGETRSIDVIEVDAASHTGVDNVRENIIENVQFKPTKSKYKVFIIDEVHMLSTASFNALLKTLEEPPAYVVFILATTDPQKLPATVISRCQRFTFSKVADTDMHAYITAIAKKEGIKIDSNVVDRLVRKSEGCVRDAISLLDQLMSSGEKHITPDVANMVLPATPIEVQLEFAEKLISKNQQDALIYLSHLSEQETNLLHFSTQLIELFRMVMIAKVDAKLVEKEIDLTKESLQRIRTLSELLSYSEAVRLIDLTLKRHTELKQSFLPLLPLEMLVIEWCNSTEDAHMGKGQNNNPPSVPPTNPNSTENSSPNFSPKKDVATKTRLADKVKEIIIKHSDVSHETVLSQWPQFIQKIEKESPSLVFILKMAELVETRGNSIIITVPYSFHQEKLMQKTVKHRLDQILSELVGSGVMLEIMVKESIQGNQGSEELQNLAAALGGEVLSQ